MLLFVICFYFSLGYFSYIFVLFPNFVYVPTVAFSFDRDWKKIEAFIGSKTVIQVSFQRTVLVWST